MPKVTFQPSGLECEADIGDNLLKIANRNKAGIKFSCGGVPSCAMCRVVVKTGIEHLSPIAQNEIELMGNTFFLTKMRLSCQASLISDGEVIVDISEHLVAKSDAKPGETYKSSFRKPEKEWRISEKEKESLPNKNDRRRRPRPEKKLNKENSDRVVPKIEQPKG